MAKAPKRKKHAHLWVRHPDDWYVEPAWCNDALFAAVQFKGVVVDPACGMGRVLDAAKRAGLKTIGHDIADRGARANHIFAQTNFFGDETDHQYDNIASNPPYKYDEAFLTEALKRSRRLTALLLRTQWANAGARSRWLESLPLRYVLALSPRPSMPPGPVIEAMNGKDPSGGQQDFAWFVFERGYSGKPEFGWARRPARAPANKPARRVK